VTEQRRRRLLVVSCSERKRDDPNPLPALDRYDGVNFRVIKKAMREGRWPQGLDLLILSAEHGLIDPGQLIGPYDRRMTPQRVADLASKVGEVLRRRFRRTAYDEIFVNAGKDYLPALTFLEELDNARLVVRYAEGGIGQKMAAMKRWIDKPAMALIS
jgi:hypothetical protein